MSQKLQRASKWLGDQTPASAVFVANSALVDERRPKNAAVATRNATSPSLHFHPLAAVVVAVVVAAAAVGAVAAVDGGRTTGEQLAIAAVAVRTAAVWTDGGN